MGGEILGAQVNDETIKMLQSALCNILYSTQWKSLDEVTKRGEEKYTGGTKRNFPFSSVLLALFVNFLPSFFTIY